MLPLTGGIITGDAVVVSVCVGIVCAVVVTIGKVQAGVVCTVVSATGVSAVVGIVCHVDVPEPFVPLGTVALGYIVPEVGTVAGGYVVPCVGTVAGGYVISSVVCCAVVSSGAASAVGVVSSGRVPRGVFSVVAFGILSLHPAIQTSESKTQAQSIPAIILFKIYHLPF